jgi:hypothetical protein
LAKHPHHGCARIWQSRCQMSICAPRLLFAGRSLVPTHLRAYAIAAAGPLDACA